MPQTSDFSKRVRFLGLDPGPGLGRKNKLKRRKKKEGTEESKRRKRRKKKEDGKNSKKKAERRQNKVGKRMKKVLPLAAQLPQTSDFFKTKSNFWQKFCPRQRSCPGQVISSKKQTHLGKVLP